MTENNLIIGVAYLFCTEKGRYKGELKSIEALSNDCFRLQFKHLKMEKERCVWNGERQVLSDKFVKVKQWVFDLSEITYIQPENETLETKMCVQENLFA